ncbi:flagellin N-terminal helical domain-containing protein [Herbiconiux sp. SYSU D00978]|uniref:flagellin N-terminal helical domain-containing protein n=1 Tax=Herbiconiux sp. SYSU D00978 TaxID=2812562 RepID=UPI001A97C407|nr:flagellar hook-associated protein 3 [Herbiconiux sp. SYSU D00978]
MIGRITDQSLLRAAQSNLQSSKNTLAVAQERASSLAAIGKPSDDPRGAVTSMQVRSDIAANAQHARNADNAEGWLTTIDSALSRSTELVGRARVLLLQGSNDGSMSQTARDAIAAELTGLRDSLLQQANSTYLGRSVFAGTSDAGSAFGSGPDYDATPVSGVVNREIAEGVTVRVDADGAKIFGEGDNSVFRVLDDLAAKLKLGTSISGDIARFDQVTAGIVGASAEVGSRHSLVLRTQEDLMARNVELETSRAGVEDLDLAEQLLELQFQENAYQRALAVTARALPATLLDYLR